MVLEELWYGNINPLEDSTAGNAEVKKLLSLVGRNRDKLCEGMTEQQKADLAKYDDCVNEMYGIIEQEVCCGAMLVHGTSRRRPLRGVP